MNKKIEFIMNGTTKSVNKYYDKIEQERQIKLKFEKDRKNHLIELKLKIEQDRQNNLNELKLKYEQAKQKINYLGVLNELQIRKNYM